LVAGLASIVLAAAALITVSSAQASFSVEQFDVSTVDAAGEPVVQAGAHPYSMTTYFETNVITDEVGHEVPEESIKTVKVSLPAGMVGNPAAVPKCSRTQFIAQNLCPPDTQVGLVQLKVASAGEGSPTAIYNMDPPPGVPAQLGMIISGVRVYLNASIEAGSGYTVTTTGANIVTVVSVYGTKVVLWGVPADPVHDIQRCRDVLSNLVCGGSSPNDAPHASGAPLKPFLTMPTRCGSPLTSNLSVDSYQAPGVWKTGSDTDPPLAGCDRLEFDPSLAAVPDEQSPGTPSGFSVDISLPQHEGLESTAVAHLRKAVVKLPEGMAVSPSSADGLQGCSPAEIGLGNDAAPACPDAAKIGTVSIDTPLLSEDLQGEVYLAEQRKNPFGSLMALYLTAAGPGTQIKLPGRVDVDPATGRITTTFDDLPQLPFNSMHLHLKGGPRAPLTTPDACGDHRTEAEFTSWSGKTVSTGSRFAIAGACGTGFAPSLSAGSTNPVAGSASPFRLRVSRHAGDQKLGRIDLTLPPGQLARLRGIPYCPDSILAGISADEGAAAAEVSAPSCPAASQVGKVTVGAGAGSNPLYVNTGKAYLAGPYKGAPLSIAFVTPAIAGPFDLGNVVVRSALRVDPVTAQVRAVSDPLPTILHGIPLDLRDVRVSLDRPQFTLNPTSCEEMQVAGTVSSSAGTVAPVSNRYQVAGCAELGFKPKLSLKLSGATHRSAHPKLRAVLKARKGDANIGKAMVTLPKTEYLENAHIRTVCTRVQYAADKCPKGSVYGYAKAWSPLLDKPLQGPVYLRSSNHQLPDLVASLDGQIQVDLAGRIDSVNERIRNTFWAVPDAPVSRFVLTMQGGKKGLLVNNTELCKAKPHASVEFTGHNGKRSSSNPLVKADCGKK
jgi:hypothetical protein